MDSALEGSQSHRREGRNPAKNPAGGTQEQYFFGFLCVKPGKRLYMYKYPQRQTLAS
jgi:hypothetical protein